MVRIPSAALLLMLACNGVAATITLPPVQFRGTSTEIRSTYYYHNSGAQSGGIEVDTSLSGSAGFKLQLYHIAPYSAPYDTSALGCSIVCFATVTHDAVSGFVESLSYSLGLTGHVQLEVISAGEYTTYIIPLVTGRMDSVSDYTETRSGEIDSFISTVTYTFHEVPEPATALAIPLIVLAFSRTSRVRRN